MIFEVELRAFGGGAIRRVTLPSDAAFYGGMPDGSLLHLIFRYGQNDFACAEDLAQRLPSVSVGDVIKFYSKRYVVAPLGFRELAEGEQPDVGPGGILEYLR